MTTATWYVFRVQVNNHPALLQIEQRKDETRASIKFDGHPGWEAFEKGLLWNAEVGVFEANKQGKTFKAVINSMGKLSGTVTYLQKGVPRSLGWSGEQFVTPNEELPYKQAWRILANGYRALLELEVLQGGMTRARLTFDKLGAAEVLVDAYYGVENGLVHFTRSTGNQVFDGCVILGKMAGLFRTNGKAYSWQGHRVDNDTMSVDRTISLRLETNVPATVKLGARQGQLFCNGYITEGNDPRPKELYDVFFNADDGFLHFKHGKHVYDGQEINGQCHGTVWVQSADRTFAWHEEDTKAAKVSPVAQ